MWDHTVSTQSHPGMEAPWMLVLRLLQARLSSTFLPSSQAPILIICCF